MKYYSIIGILSFTLLSACSKQPEKVDEKEEKYCLEEPFKKDVEFITASREQVSEGIHLTGTIIANPDKILTFNSLFSGVVTGTFFSLGDKVKKGQLLAEVSSAEFSALNAELQSLESQLKLAETKLRSVKSMFSDGVASQKDLFEAQSALDVLNAEKAKVNSNRSLYSASNTKNVFRIIAPSPGIVTSKNIATGMQISADNDEPLFVISDLDDVWLMANVYASNLRHIRQGMEVDIKTVSYPDEIFKGRISVISSVLDENEKVLKARIVLSNKDQRLKPGMLADITALKKQEAEAVSIPSSAVIFANNENFVLVYKDDCDISIRKINLLTKNSNRVFVSEGLSENEKVISKNQLLLFTKLNQ